MKTLAGLEFMFCLHLLLLVMLLLWPPENFPNYLLILYHVTLDSTRCPYKNIEMWKGRGFITLPIQAQLLLENPLLSLVQ